MSSFGERVELARYRLPGGERVLFGQRIDGAVAVADVPADDQGGVYLVERQVQSKAELDGLVAAYVADSRRRGQPAARCPNAKAFADTPDLAGAVAAVGRTAHRRRPDSASRSSHHRQGDDSR